MLQSMGCKELDTTQGLNNNNKKKREVLKRGFKKEREGPLKWSSGVESLLANIRDMGSIPGPGNISHAAGRLSPQAAATEIQTPQGPCSTRKATAMRNPYTATRESPHAEMKPRHSTAKINKQMRRLKGVKEKQSIGQNLNGKREVKEDLGEMNPEKKVLCMVRTG